jgi:hypothetical protein
MKKLIVTSLLILSVLACKKKELSPEGPTDVRIRNKSDLTFQNVIVILRRQEILSLSELFQMVPLLITSDSQKHIPRQKFLQ